jgi:hypothetical protein
LHKNSLYQPAPLLLESKTRIFFTHTAVRLLFFLYKGEEEGEKKNLLPLTPPPPLLSVCRSLSLSLPLCLRLPLAPVKPAKASKKLTIQQELDTKLHIYNPLLRISHTKQQQQQPRWTTFFSHSPPPSQLSSPRMQQTQGAPKSRLSSLGNKEQFYVS